MNYKPYHTQIQIAGFIISIPESAKLVHLFDRTGGSSAVESMTNAQDDLIYFVPTGKTFHCVGVMITAVTGGGYVTLYSGDTQDAKTAEIHAVHHSSRIYFKQETLIDYTWASGKYVVIEPNNVFLTHLDLIGYEI